MIRAVIDTNVYMAALLSRDGAPARLMRSLSDGVFDAVVCPALLGEVRGVLARPKISERVSPRDARAYVEWIERVALAQKDPVDIPGISPDPDDDYLIALAEQCCARVIVTGDAHLLGLVIADLRVLSPAAFSDLIDSLR